ncbi:MAG: hypothetical protein WDW38_008966 [Sanguina aurantia]
MASDGSFKDQGNQEYKLGNFLKAAGLYTKAIKEDAGNGVLYSNRSAALLKLKKVTKALEDAEEVIRLRPEWEKGYVRKANVLEDQEQFAEALSAYELALAITPDSTEIVVKVRFLCRKLGLPMKVAAPPAPPPKQPSHFRPLPTPTPKTHRKHAHKPPAASQRAIDRSTPDSGPSELSLTVSADLFASHCAPTQQTRRTRGATQILPAQTSDEEDAGGVQQTLEDQVEAAVGKGPLAQFALEHLELTGQEMMEGGTGFSPLVHFLPGGSTSEADEQEHHVRAETAFCDPDALSNFKEDMRQRCARLGAKGVVAVMPKPAISCPQVWKKADWPLGDVDGVFVQLDSQAVKVLWFIPMSEPKLPG